MRDILNSAIEKSKNRFKYRELPKFPSVIRDISFTVPPDVKAGNIDTVLKASKNKLLKDFRIFDYYVSNQLKSWCGIKKIAIQKT
jgi:phenylalanyl-tRNA synthetase beta chain